MDTKNGISEGTYMITIYNKAIRDKIPEIIKKSGKTGIFRQLTNEEFLSELEKKLNEEIQEYFLNRSIEEFADMIEIIYRIIELRNIDKEEFEKIRIEKMRKNGGFTKNLFLLEVKAC